MSWSKRITATAGAVILLSGCGSSSPELGQSSEANSASGATETLASETERVLVREWNVDSIEDRCGPSGKDWQCDFRALDSSEADDVLEVRIANTQERADEPAYAQDIAVELRTLLQPQIKRLREIVVTVNGKEKAGVYRLSD